MFDELMFLMDFFPVCLRSEIAFLIMLDGGGGGMAGKHDNSLQHFLLSFLHSSLFQMFWKNAHFGIHVHLRLCYSRFFGVVFNVVNFRKKKIMTMNFIISIYLLK